MRFAQEKRCQAWNKGAQCMRKAIARGYCNRCRQRVARNGHTRVFQPWQKILEEKRTAEERASDD
jgi:hypothetical protein